MVYSETITVTGLNSRAVITVVGGEYSLDGGPWTGFQGLVEEGTKVRVRHLSASTPDTSVSTQLTIGGLTGVFTSSTAAAENANPDHFYFTSQVGVPLGSTRVSNAITVSGITGFARVRIVGGEYSINGGTFTAADGTVRSGDSVCVRHIAAATNSMSVTTTLTIGGVSSSFASTTVAIPSINADTVYRSKCAGCHFLGGTLDTGNPLNLSRKGDLVVSKYMEPGSPGHQSRVLSAGEIAALTAYLNSR